MCYNNINGCGMTDVVSLVTRHGYAILAAAVFLEAVGMPVPAALALLVSGAAIARHTMRPALAIPVAVMAMMFGDTLLYILGRFTGWALLGALCRLSLHPETCILRSAESFYRRGRATLLFAKFIPGVNTMAPPLAGSMKMPVGQFLRFDSGGVCLYVAAWGGLGFLGSDFLGLLIRGAHSVGRAMEILIAIAVLGYVIYRLVVYWKNRTYRVVPRIQVSELARKLAEEPERLVLADVRSHGYYDRGATRIRGSIRLEPNQLPERLQELPRDREIYLYCT